MLEKEIELLKNIATPAIEKTIEAYSNWIITASFFWTMVGFTILVSAWFAFKWWKKEDFDDEPAPKIFFLVCIGFLCLIGFTFVGANIADLINPKAAAIHSLLMDIRGGGK